MKIYATVHNASGGLLPVNAQIDGENARVLTDGVEVELVPDGGRHGTLTLRFTGKDTTEAKELFKPGAKICVDLTAG